VSRTIHGVSILAVALTACTGCTSYRYMRDATPEIEETRVDYVTNNPNNDFNKDIRAGRVRKGMSRLQVRVTWGEPDLTNNRGGGMETWTYVEPDASRGDASYVLDFEGEILTSVAFQHSGVPPSTTDTDRDPEQTQPPQNPNPSKKPAGGY
jgi:outer membrane protein assembly factor BamE (lipoprotein component of BamABCDE complex)